MLDQPLQQISAVIAAAWANTGLFNGSTGFAAGVQSCMTDLFVNDEQTTQSNAIVRQHIVLLADLPLQVRHKGVVQISNTSFFPVCGSIYSSEYK